MKKFFLFLIAFALTASMSVVFAAAFNMHQAMKSLRGNFKCLASGGLTCKGDAAELAEFKATLQASDQNIQAYYDSLVAEKLIPALPAMDEVHAAFAAILVEVQNIEAALQSGNAEAKGIAIKNIKTIMDQAHDKFRPEM